MDQKLNLETKGVYMNNLQKMRASMDALVVLGDRLFNIVLYKDKDLLIELRAMRETANTLQIQMESLETKLRERANQQ